MVYTYHCSIFYDEWVTSLPSDARELPSYVKLVLQWQPESLCIASHATPYNKGGLHACSGHSFVRSCTGFIRTYKIAIITPTFQGSILVQQSHSRCGWETARSSEGPDGLPSMMISLETSHPN